MAGFFATVLLVCAADTTEFAMFAGLAALGLVGVVIAAGAGATEPRAAVIAALPVAVRVAAELFTCAAVPVTAAAVAGAVGAAPAVGLAVAGTADAPAATAEVAPVAVGTQGVPPPGFAVGAGAAAFFLPNKDFSPANCAIALLAVLLAVEVAFAVR